MSLALYPQAVSQVPQHSYLPGCNPLVTAAFPTSLPAPSFPFTPPCPEFTVQKHRSLQGRMLNIDACQSGLPIPLFTFSLKRNASRSRFDPDSVEPTCAVQHFDKPIAALYKKKKKKKKSKKEKEKEKKKKKKRKEKSKKKRKKKRRKKARKRERKKKKRRRKRPDASIHSGRRKKIEISSHFP